jgi:hypothetical protein
MSTPTRNRVHNTIIVGLVVAVAAIVLLIGLFYPKQKNTTTSYPTVGTSPTAAAGIVLPLVQLEGQWFARDDEVAFTATVTGENIEIQMSFSGETSALYWHGTFKPAESAGTKVVSTKTEGPSEIVLSQDATKEFTINQNEIVFKFSALGFTKTVLLMR